VLNLFVAGIGTFQFYRAGFFSWRVFWPFAATSIPFAFVGGMVHLPTSVYKMLLGIVLALAAFRLAWKFANVERAKPPNILIGLVVGAAVGLVSGLIGVGGGIFLTPILLLAGWAETKTAAAVSALFILVNSVSGLAGNYAQVSNVPQVAWLWIAAAVAGGLLGSTLGANRFNSLTLRRVLAAVLLFASIKLIWV
jgi:uncharacterized membrane protein YfcA